MESKGEEVSNKIKRQTTWGRLHFSKMTALTRPALHARLALLQQNFSKRRWDLCSLSLSLNRPSPRVETEEMTLLDFLG